MESAPFHDDVADGPAGGRAHWLTTSDGVRIRVGEWRGGRNGTVLLFPGRTEYIEKYGRTAGDLAARGFSTLTIDWRGQGMADRFLADRSVGHVLKFRDYQFDVAAMVEAARELDLPRPYYLIAHSMGGCIGLRALMEGLDVRAAVFSAPMWGILLSATLRPVAWTLAWSAKVAKLGHYYAPGTKAETYVIAQPFEGNILTTDPDMHAYMQKQIVEHPDLSLAGPSLNWLHEALVETRWLTRQPSPNVPCVTFLGSEEKIVEATAVRMRMANWPGGRLELVDGAEHEVMMERPETRNRFFDATAALFQQHARRAA